MKLFIAKLFAKLSRFDLIKNAHDCLNEVFIFLRKHNLLPLSKYRKLKRYKDIHKGKRCFIVCTGPSLTVEDLDKLKGELTLSVNSIPLSFGETSWRPTYYVIVGKSIFKALIKHERYDLAGVKGVFVARGVDRFIKATKYRGLAEYDVFCQSRYKAGRLRVKDERQWIASPHKIRFSDNIYAATFGANVAPATLQIAVYMGFSEIYLLGADCGIKAGQKAHAVEYRTGEDKNSPENVLRTDPRSVCASFETLVLAYQSAKEYADAHGIRIYNATRGGALEVFERVDLDGVLAQSFSQR